MNKRRLLIFDDEEDFAAFIRRVGEKLDFEVAVATNAADFKAAYQRCKPEVITLDIVIPEFDGIEAIKWLKEQKCSAHLVIISGFDPHYAEIANTLGTLGNFASIQRLSKPVTVAALEGAMTVLGGFSVHR